MLLCEGAGSLMVWETVTRNYFIFFSALEFWVFFLHLWSDEQCSSCYMLSLIRLYLNNIGSKCNQAASCLFVKELALLWCGRQLLEIISSFFLCSRCLGFLFAVPNFTDGFMRLSNSQMKQETNVIAIVTYLSYVALKWCMTSPSYINRLFLHCCFRVRISIEAAVCCNDGVK